MKRLPVAWPVLAVWGLVALYIIFFGVLTIQQHNAFQTTAFDLGNVDQAVWNTRHGRPFHMTNIEGLTNRLGTHVEPVLLPISLLYFLWSDPRLLLLVQTVVIALGAWPVYLLSRRKLEEAGVTHPALAVLFAGVYLLFPALQSANVFDFHAVALAPTFFLFALYCLESERWGWYALFVGLTMSCKEDMPLLVAMLGLYALVIHRRWKVGLLTIGAAIVWFGVAVGLIMPYFDTRGVSPLANRYAYLGDSPLEMLVTILTRPGLVLEQLWAADALGYVRNLLAPVLYISLLAPEILLLALPPLAVNLLSTEGAMHQLEGFHYGATLVPAVVVSAAYAVARLSRRFSQVRVLPFFLALLVLVVSLAYHHRHGYTPLAADFAGSWPHITRHHQLGADIAGEIPTALSLAALPFPNPHASQRQQLTMIDRIEAGRPAPLNDAEYVWLDVTRSWPLHPNDLKTGVDNLLVDEYGLDRAVDGWLLLRRGASEVELPDAFYDFAREPQPKPQYGLRLQFLLDGQPVLETLGFDLAYDRRAKTHALTVYWRALHPLPAGLRLYPFYVDDATGRILEDTALRPLIATVWYPTDRWVVGEVIKTSTLPWDVGDEFSVGLGVMQGDDWSDVDRRLPIRLEDSELVVRLFDGDTWARLLEVDRGTLLEEVRRYEPPASENTVNAELGDQVRLTGYDLDCDRKDGVCALELHWQAQTGMDTSYSVFVQWLDASGTVRSQADSIPQDGGYPTVWWLPGEYVSDSHTLSVPPTESMTAGDRLIVGMYDPVTGTRLPVVGTGNDFVDLGPIP